MPAVALGDPLLAPPGGAEEPRRRSKPTISVSVPPRGRPVLTELALGEDGEGALPAPRFDALAAQAGDISPLAWRSAAPLRRRQTARRQRPRVLWAALPGGSAAAEALSFPHVADCAHCGRQLRAAEARWGTGLCDRCWSCCLKDCSICKQRLPLKQLQWGSGLCRICFEACDKDCRMCGSDLAIGQLHWGTGLCDNCYNSCEKTCRMCHGRLEPSQLRWGSGLCDGCYSSCQKTCRICRTKLHVRQLRWGTGLCDRCYDDSEKTCRHCRSNIALGSMHYRTGLCDTCYDACEKSCKVCNARLELRQINGGTGLCDDCCGQGERTCNMCRSEIDAQQLHWGTGLCDGCYNACGKVCKLCEDRLDFGQLHWGSGLCDNCYASCEKQCLRCQTHLPLGQLHWGTRLCDACFDACEKTCRGCQSRLDVGQLHYCTGLCDTCYDAALRAPTVRLSSGVRAAIGAQLVFYMTPGLLQPSLYLQIRAASDDASAPSLYAAVLTTASVAAMVFPVPLGLWAERRGEREVYYGIAVAAAVAAAGLALLPPVPLFALCWAVLTGPPAIRGVRAAYFARQVPPEELSRAGQLASSSGLMGGFLGPVGSALLSQALGGGAGEGWPDGFAAGAAVGALACGACAAALAASMPRDARKAKRSHSGLGLRGGEAELCERCSVELRPEESRYALALCDPCYNNYAGIAGRSYSFAQFRTRVLFGFCLVAAFLECSMNAAIIASFQPIVVTHFGWGNDAIALVNFAGAGLSVVVSLLMAWARLKERTQTAAAAGLYLVGVLVFTVPPLRQWRAVLGLLLGIKAQILFMAPFTAIFSRLIGKMRVTNRLTTALCLAPAIGAALGTAAAPWFIARAGGPAFLLSSLPALAGVLGIAVGWPLLQS